MGFQFAVIVSKQKSIETKISLSYRMWSSRHKWVCKDPCLRILQEGTFVNAENINQGYGFAYPRFPFKYMDGFRRYQREAREQNRGLWAKAP